MVSFIKALMYDEFYWKINENYEMITIWKRIKRIGQDFGKALS